MVAPGGSSAFFAFWGSSAFSGFPGRPRCASRTGAAQPQTTGAKAESRKIKSRNDCKQNTGKPAEGGEWLTCCLLAFSIPHVRLRAGAGRVEKKAREQNVNKVVVVVGGSWWPFGFLMFVVCFAPFAFVFFWLFCFRVFREGSCGPAGLEPPSPSPQEPKQKAENT